MVVYSEQRKAQQSNTQAKALKGTARERGKQKKVGRIFKMLKEVQLNIRIEKVDMYKSITVKPLLDNGATEIFVDKKIVAKHEFRL